MPNILVATASAPPVGLDRVQAAAARVRAVLDKHDFRALPSSADGCCITMADFDREEARADARNAAMQELHEAYAALMNALHDDAAESNFEVTSTAPIEPNMAEYECGISIIDGSW